MNIRNMIQRMKDALVTDASRVVETTEDGRIIQSGKDTYTTKQSYSEGEDEYYGTGGPMDAISTEYKFKNRRFEVKDQDGNSESLTVEKRNITYEGDREVYDSVVYFGERDKVLNSKEILYAGKDLNNINDIRYQVRNNPKFSYFLDKFFIVTPEEKKSYKQYAKKQDNIAEQKRRDAKIAAKKAEDERLKKNALDAQRKSKEMEIMRLQEATKRKIDEKFRGTR